MARHDSGLPHENPCAQCGKPIAAPDWTENGPRRISYLWHCRACDYRFEAVAFYDASHPSQEALAAYRNSAGVVFSVARSARRSRFVPTGKNLPFFKSLSVQGTCRERNCPFGFFVLSAT
jgi:hypothetical protein